MPDESPRVEEARVLRIEDGDLLAIRIAHHPNDAEADAIADGIAEWSGLPRDRIVILVGADLTIIRPGGTPDGS